VSFSHSFVTIKLEEGPPPIEYVLESKLLVQGSSLKSIRLCEEVRVMAGSMAVR
jgi:hypothetical protein